MAESCNCKKIVREFEHSIPLTPNPFYTDKTYNKLRRMKLIILSNKLGQLNEFKNMSYENQLNMIKCIENSCLNEAIRKAREYNIRCMWSNIQFENIYHSICYNILSTLDLNSETGSRELVKKIFEGVIDLKTIARMSCKELCPEMYEDIKKRIEERNNTEQTVKATTLYFCKNCKRNKTHAKSVQNRCGDEGNNYFITCLFCGNKWFS